MVTTGAREGVKVKKYGSTVNNVFAARLANHESIKSFLTKLGSDCVAHERYADGTLFFSGAVSPAAMSKFNIVPKRGWRPEIRRSRTLSLLVKGKRGEEIPTLTAEDALDVVRQSPLWKEIPNVELIRIANTNGKVAHVFLQFEGEVMARRLVNMVDAMTYTHKETGRKFFVHGSQLNAYYEYEPQAGSCDPTVWWNPEYIGFRCVTVNLHAAGKARTPLRDAQGVTDNLLVQVLERGLGGAVFANSVEMVRRVDMESEGSNLILQVRPGHNVGAVVDRLTAAFKGLVVPSLTQAQMQLTCSRAHRSRKSDYEAVDRVMWDSRVDPASSSGDDEEGSVGSLPRFATSGSLQGMMASTTSSAVPLAEMEKTASGFSLSPSLENSFAVPESSVSSWSTSPSATPRTQDVQKAVEPVPLAQQNDDLQSSLTSYEPEMCSYFFA
eukprot:TRINITY_DN8348_c0_g3_i1.p2 TRINITY_DN8348_c0_g3~~TRINITY_DN8348_c0_g3_i1.p2  ORF type:complete len:440 (+),score=169.53 TRINITY_DN8348_c0_g3_i1:521-1840(+)